MNEFSIDKKLENLIVNLDFSGDFTEIRKFYAGLPFDKKDTNMIKLINSSKQVCEEYDDVLESLSIAKTPEEKKFLENRKNELLDILFPGHGQFANVYKGVRVTIGAVDFGACGNINRNVTVDDYCLVECGDYTLFGPNIKIGFSDKPNKNYQAAGKVVFEGDDWICAGVTIDPDVKIGKQSVIALGSAVRSDIEESVFAVGDPCQTKIKLDKNYQTKTKKSGYRSEEEIKFLSDHINKLGIEGDLTEYIRALNGEKFNCFDSVVNQLFDLSHNLSYEYNNKNTTYQRKQEILDILFPIHGENFSAKSGLFVDMLGMAKVGNNVHLGKNNFIAGNVIFGDNVTVGDNNYFAGFGHEVYYEGRKLQQFHDVFGEICTVGSITVDDNIKIGDNCTIAPNTHITRNIDNENIKTQKDILSKEEKRNFW